MNGKRKPVPSWVRSLTWKVAVPLLGFRKETLISALQGIDTSTEERFKENIIPILAKLLRVPERRIRRQFVLTPHNGARSLRCDIAVMGKILKKRPVMIIELKTERGLAEEKKRNPNGIDPFKTGIHQLVTYMGFAKTDIGLLITEKRIHIATLEFSDLSAIPEQSFTSIIFRPDVIEFSLLPTWLILVFVVGVSIVITLLGSIIR